MPLTALFSSRPCPLCGQPARLLDVGGNGPFARAADYHRCDRCGHVWALDKSDPNAPAIPISASAAASQS